MNTDLKKAIRDYAVTSITLFFTSFYTELNPSNLLENLNMEVITRASQTGLNALWIALPTSIGLFAYRKMRPTQIDNFQDIGNPPDHL